MIVRFLFFISLFIYSTIEAQTFQWAKSAGQWVDDIPYESLYDQVGNLYVTGEISHGAKFDNVIAPEWGAFLVKYDPTGKMLWVRFGLGSYNGQGNDLALDSEGNIYVGGSFSYEIKFGNITLNAGHNSKVFLVKYTPQGDVLWAKVLGNPATSSWDGCGGLTVDQQDNVYITGVFTYNYSLENNVILLDPFIDYWPDGDCFLVKYNKQGQLQWGKVAATPYEDDRAIGLKTGADNKIYWGIQPGSGNFKYDNYEMQNWDFQNGGSLILILSTTGERINTLPIYAALESFIVKESRIVASGSFYRKARFTENIELSSEATDGFLVRYDQDYKPDLVKKLPKSVAKVAVYKNDIFVAGTFYNKFSIDDLSVSTSSRNLFILKLNSIGYAQWIKTADMGLWGSVGVTSVAISNQGAIGITGMYSKSKMQLDGIELVNNSGNDDGDIFVAVIDDHTPNKCPMITSSINVDKKIICEGEKSLIQATGINNNLIMWYRNGEPYTDSEYSFTSQVGEGGNYYYLLNPNTDCEIKSDTIEIRKIDMPVVELNILPANQNCDNQPVTIHTSASETYTFKWYKDDSSLPNAESTLLAKSTGRYKVIVTNEGYCSSTKSTDILILPPEPDFLPDTIFHCLDKKVDVKPTLNYSGWNYEWSSGDVTSEVVLSKEGVYELKIHSGNCEATDRVTFTRYKDLWAPNVITPNGDNTNDTFVVKNNDGSAHLSIYDRWGALIYNKENYANDWTAVNVSAGVYFYYISNQECRGDDALKGWLQIIK